MANVTSSIFWHYSKPRLRIKFAKRAFSFSLIGIVEFNVPLDTL